MNDILEKIMGKVDALYYNRPTPEQTYRKFENANLFITYLLAVSTYIIFLIFVVLLLYSPLFIQSEDRVIQGLGAFTYNLVSVFMMCHQLPMRSLFISGVQQAVCARDMGIYLGMAAAGFLFLKKTPDFCKTKKFFILTIVPIAVDGVTQTILNLRESNNILRITTGLIFGFGLTIFILTRIKRLNRPEFKETLKDKKFILAVTVSTIITLSLLFPLGGMFGSVYTTKNEAIKVAGAKASENLLVYYLPPRTPFSYHFYQHKEYYQDNVLSDLGEMKWIEIQIKFLLNDSQMLDSSDFLGSLTSIEPIPLQHYYGIWVIVRPSGQDNDGRGNAVFTVRKGNYTYIDALTQEVFEKHEH